MVAAATDHLLIPAAEEAIKSINQLIRLAYWELI
jgi:hypothetical protein